MIGKATRRVDGPKKVRGAAPYAADQAIEPTPYIGWIVEATIGKGRVVSIDTAAAEREPGVVRVLTHENTPKQIPYGETRDGSDADRFTMSHALLNGTEIRHPGQAVALVVAGTLEAARGAALLVKVTYETDDGRYVVTGEEPEDLLVVPDELDGGQEPDVVKGDIDAAMAEAAHTLDVEYTTPSQISAAMEPHATIAVWADGELTLYLSIQVIGWAITALANTFGLEKSQVRILSPFTGGGFGSKLGVHGDAVLASLAAMTLEHPVKVVQTRRSVFVNAPHRGSSIQRLRLAADAEGKLLGVGHDSRMPMASYGYEFAEPTAAGARASYETPALHTVHRVVKVDLPPIDSMRAPGEAIGSLALEGALDELAHDLGLDPLELRLRNLADREPQSGKPFASNDLRRCLEKGAEAFGWTDRPEPRQRDGRWWRGWGMAACTRVNMLMEGAARIRLDADGRARAELDMTDIGTGSYTILTQIAAEGLGLPLESVEVVLGDSRLPETAGSGGSFGAATAGGALKNATDNLCARLVELARDHGDSPLRGAEGEGRVAEGRVWIGDRSLGFDEVVGLVGGELSAEGSIAPGENSEKYAQYAYGAHFVTLRVDGVTGEVRLERALGAFSFGRVLNPITARSQLIGGMTYGIGGALTEALHVDPRSGAFPNRDFAEYHLAVQRDVPPLEVHMLGEPDEKCGALGSKGIGELGLCGIGGAIANAVFHATGVRVREMPITPDKVLAGLMAQGD
ncbi:MAG: xanthine dehydrogenase [Sandaracinus sp.]|nr:xanthine dehydrogenase [Sandaracinus sp.]|tara:strand:- start:1103 stop:3331 length:2229 start_codon:yes stop_codon:yes gene_type:complete